MGVDWVTYFQTTLNEGVMDVDSQYNLCEMCYLVAVFIKQ